MPASDLVRVHALVMGRVQGVGFRFTTVDAARRLGVKGWVRNCADGSVEALLEGERAAVEALVRFLHRGPPGAFVQDVSLHYEAPKGEEEPFHARH